MKGEIMLEKEMTEFAEMGLNLFDRLMKWKEIGLNAKARLRLLYAECHRNLALLEAIEFNETSTEVNPEELIPFIDQLDFQFLEMIFLEGKENRMLFKLIQNVELYNEEGEENKKLDFSDFSILLNKMTILKKLVYIKKNKMLKMIRYKVRINNIVKLLKAIIDGIKKNENVLLNIKK